MTNKEKPHLILILHGWGGSKDSNSVQRIAKAINSEQHSSDCQHIVYQLITPSLNYHEPSVTQSQLKEVVNNIDSQATVIGFSMGGFWARWLANTYPDKFSNLILINPSLDAPRNCKKYLGKNENRLTGEVYNFTNESLNELENYRVQKDRLDLPISAIVATDDEVIRPSVVEEFIGSSRCKIEYTNGGHRLDANNNWLEMIKSSLYFTW